MNSRLKKIILNALMEDLLPKGDITTECLISDKHKSLFKLVVNESAILAGVRVFKETFKLLDKDILVKERFTDGDKVKKGQIVATVLGRTSSILKGERTALNFASHLSGIATLTSELVNLVKGTRVILLDTRKTTPSLRAVEKQAVVCGKAKNHRQNLSEMILIKDNHIKAIGGIKNAIQLARRKYKSKTKIEVEVNNTNELNEAIALKPDVIMFDNWNIRDLRRALKAVPRSIITEASGQITKENIRAYASTGVDYISSSYMIKNARWIDFSLDLIKKDSK